MSPASPGPAALREAVERAVALGHARREEADLVLEQLASADAGSVSVAQVAFLLDLDENLVARLAAGDAGAEARAVATADTDPHASGPDPLLGASLDGFVVEELIGEGGMGRVYRARQEALHRDVALKVLAASRVGDAEAARRFLREGRAAAALSHPHVVTCHGMGRTGDHLWVAMELLPGGDLEARLRRHGGVMPEARALSVARDAALGLAALEDAGLVHRDIKPANVFLTPDGRAKLGDLGLACSRRGDDRVTRTGLVVGTPAYMAPEQAEGHEPDVRADVYALGATLYRMLTGEPPFSGTELTILRKKLDGPPPDPRAARPSVSPATARLVLRAMARRPEDRPRTARELLAEIDAAAAALAGGATSPSRRRRMTLAALAAVAVVAASLAAWRVARGPASRPPAPDGASAPAPVPEPEAMGASAPGGVSFGQELPQGAAVVPLRPAAGSFAIAQDDGWLVDPGDEDWRRTGFFDTRARPASGPVEVTYRIYAEATRDAPPGVLAEQGFTHAGGFFFELGLRGENSEVSAGADLQGFALWLTLVVDARGDAHGLVRAIGPDKPPGRLDAGLPGVAVLDAFTIPRAFADGPLDVTVTTGRVPRSSVVVSRAGRVLESRAWQWGATPLEAGPDVSQPLYAWAHAGNWAGGRGTGRLAATAR